jgi:hypothetical protein
MGLKDVTGNLITSATLDSVSTEDASGFYNKENLYSKMQALPWRSTEKSGVYAIIDLGADTAVTFCGLYNHNLSTGATVVKLKGYLQATGKPADGSEAGDYDEDFTITAGHQNCYLTLSETMRYWALLLTEAGNANNLEVGEMVLGTHASFTKNFVYPYREVLRYLRGETITPSGQRWLNKKGKFKRFLLDFLGVTDTNLISELEAFFEAIDGELPFVFVPNDAAVYSWYVDCLSDLNAERAWYNYNNVQVELVEQGRGQTLL